ncbi:efflux RND transporter periplasmic adaptor subunit [Flammeovirga kamogawensis]|uniref:HlyD family efflux transporter periplasmic adaptor subunit n=1 Tax=Flammeovirga kamogawensis TaxID=373891 RepID=A0ABX8GVF9_9BACT|nr:HlyD family efflux transporter periplasmic adaptor subunit [Flammeovirga kamogawensis]MBB6459812.1 multidrug efflux pump subunit AcrA (membrane-fusion protein) [Flammeovirga kamogawensis]QWG07132.1 HlyD family efflux transporter periplasmic adaptor subunit [Flammeovirga kamogawensis]TRX68954.1 HlyD family efflux transporter periplasmic adaptor subunit [Flammeovirga kamogawensis]
MTSKKSIIGVGIAVLLLISFFYFNTSSNETVLLTKVRKGDLKINVTTTGELEAEKSVQIRGPLGMRKASVWEAKINSLVPEGTLVKQGDQVAQLDPSSLSDQLSKMETELTKSESQWEQTQLDSALQLSKERDNLINLEFVVEEKKIQLEESAFEPPSTIKKCKMDVKKAERDLKQSKANYIVKQQQLSAKMREVTANLNAAKRNVNFLKTLFGEFTIFAPEDGMIIYTKDWNGNKVKEGSNIQAWNPVVATLPDLSSMLSKTFVNEVDIRKIKKGQKVNIGLDAFPDKKLNGEVTHVANVGEQRPNSDAKVFEVSILLAKTDSTLRPSMTTSNEIKTEEKTDILLIPIEALHVQGDSANFVFIKNINSYDIQEVKIGLMNDQDVEIISGLKENDIIALSTPPSHLEEPSK